MKSQSRLAGKRVAVIGGTSGIGFAIAAGALAEGAQVFVGSSNAANVERSLARLGAGASGAAVDVRDEASVAAFFERAGAFDHLAYTAGDWAPNRGGGAIAALDLATANATFTVRFWGALAAVKHAQGRIARDGSITLTDGAIAHRPRKGAALSTAMAGAIEHLTRALAVDLAPLRVNTVCPGYVLTEVWDSMPAERREAQFKHVAERQPLPRIGVPDEVAEAYLYLMRGGYSTGQVLVVDGGMTLV
jgi:NAD(P)-dependent dehydrogenase (short-subunit alcohol dehydrogenase family)